MKKAVSHSRRSVGTSESEAWVEMLPRLAMCRILFIQSDNISFDLDRICLTSSCRCLNSSPSFSDTKAIYSRNVVNLRQYKSFSNSEMSVMERGRRVDED